MTTSAAEPLLVAMVLLAVVMMSAFEPFSRHKTANFREL
jgi:hypothetical protein